MLPFDTSMNYWLMGIPLFRQEPVLPEVKPGAGLLDPATEGCEAGEAETPPPAELPEMRLVMVGVSWIVVPTWLPKDNPHWETFTQGERDADEQRLDQARHDLHRSQLHATGPDADAGPQVP